MANQIAVFYLSHSDLMGQGLAQLGRFLESWQASQTSLPHEVNVLLHGAGAPALRRQAADLAHSFGVRSTDVGRRQIDLNLYGDLSRRHSGRNLLFFNSHAEILADGWLEKYTDAWDGRAWRVVSATASWESPYSSLKSFAKDLVFSRRWVRWLSPLVRRILVADARYRFPPFPNPHLRTNAFFGRAECLGKVLTRCIRTRRQAFALESGRCGMLRNIYRLGGDAVVVGANGRRYRPEAWADSGTLGLGGQENLLIADNHTKRFASATELERRATALRMWGAEVDRKRLAGVVADKIEAYSK
jgi:hypothetical protein